MSGVRLLTRPQMVQDVAVGDGRLSLIDALRIRRVFGTGAQDSGVRVQNMDLLRDMQKPK